MVVLFIMHANRTETSFSAPLTKVVMFGIQIIVSDVNCNCKIKINLLNVMDCKLKIALKQ